MSFMQKFIKKKVSIQDVLSALENFSNDTKSLNEISRIASSFFGTNWKFNLELYISTMDKKDKDKYLPIIRNVLTFDKAVSLWMVAQQVLKGARPMNADIMKNIDEYEEYLPKFGVEGVRLLEKLKEKFNLSDDVVVLEKKVEDMPEPKEEVKEEVVENIEETPKPDKILKKVSSKELEEGVFVKLPKKEEPVVVKEEVEVESVVPVEKVEEKVSDDASSWEISNFVKVYGFVSQLREVMSAISLFKNATSLEEYPYYGFIVDVIDYLVLQGEKILSNQPEEVILKYFKGGKKELEEIVVFYKKQKQEEVVISNPSENGENEEK
ncbi:MAG: hypothetical protein ACI4N3_00930 [Alphaproteobacteria bacterium]